ncbi:MAG: nucleic acid binding, OB-fold, tRNA/helicase-type [uncultured bacterium]|nr:MAG: nucleic acid binding, OB-fold, tRNA/helicase-type [uncultured bacterium]HBD04960.1 hypothetical protein [Candidatus Uhrbacteria bacterium]
MLLSNQVQLILAFIIMFAMAFAPYTLRGSELPTIMISEVMWAGSSLSSADEWLELYNTTDSEIDMSGWTLRGAGSSNSDIVLATGSIAQANSAFVIANYTLGNSKTVLNINPDIVDTNLSLSNSAFKIELIDANGIAIDSAGNGLDPPAGKTNPYTTMVRSDIYAWSDATASNGFIETAQEFGTPGFAEQWIIDQLTDPVEITDQSVQTDQVTDTAGEAQTEQTAETQITADTTDTVQTEQTTDTATANPVNETDQTQQAQETELHNNIEPPKYFEGDVIINEFVSDPETGKEEWIELYNTTGFAIDLAGWILADGSTRKHKMQGMIPQNDYLLVSKPVFSLNNSGDMITLYDPGGETIDSLTFGTWDDGNITDNAPATTDPNSVALSNGKMFVTTAPTPQKENIISAPIVEEKPSAQQTSKTKTTNTTQTPSETNQETQSQTPYETTQLIPIKTLRISELYPNTDGNDAENEFIEIHNFGSEIVNLAGWVLYDASGKTHAFTTADTINPNEFVSFPRSITNITLNNSGTESVSLKSPDSEIVSQTTYENAPQGLSYSAFDAAWNWTGHITPNEQNSLSQNDPYPETVAEDQDIREPSIAPFVDIGDIRHIPIGEKIITRGIVSVEPGIIGKQIMYIAGTENGIQIYQYKGEFPETSIGDEIEVTGTISASRGETRIKIENADSMAVLGFAEEPEPFKVSIAEINEKNIGGLVEINGTITSAKTGKVRIETGGAGIDAIIKESAGITINSSDIGRQAIMRGIVSESNGVLRLIPRSEDDLEIIAETAAPAVNTDEHMASAKIEAQNSKSKTALLATFATIIAMSALAIKKFAQKRRIRIAGAIA